MKNLVFFSRFFFDLEKKEQKGCSLVKDHGLPVYPPMVLCLFYDQHNGLALWTLLELTAALGTSESLQQARNRARTVSRAIKRYMFSFVVYLLRLFVHRCDVYSFNGRIFLHIFLLYI